MDSKRSCTRSQLPTSWFVCALLCVAGVAASLAWACGGFFCQLVPIDQAGEQIIFRQDGNKVTAIVLIQYEGDAEDFSWVLPVPGVPEFELASDLVFPSLEQATRPQFVLSYEGQECFDEGDGFAQADSAAGGDAGPGDTDDGVEILQEEVVGPFDLQLVSSDDPQAMATWLDDNGYDLTERGSDLIGPYVEEGMNFVALKLRQGQGVGDIQPLKIAYESASPMIPLRLTAVAAVEDMGIIVWILGASQAVPLNYPHVEVNYTKLNWYNGTFAAYADYQGLVTDAMNETGDGLGFATDYAGTDIDVVSQLPDPDTYRLEVARLGNIADDGQFYSEAYNNFLFSQDKVAEILSRQLPLPEGEDEVVYSIPSLLQDAVGAEAMAAARNAVLNELISAIIAPLEETLTVFEGMPYITRLYTTMSADEMTVDPIFSFNPDIEDQALTRNATLTSRCTSRGTNWELRLGEGTGRDGELVIRGTGGTPGFGITVPEIDQPSISRTLLLSKTGAGEILVANDFEVADVETAGGGSGSALQDGPGSGFTLCGNGIGMMSLLSLVMLSGWHARRQK